LTSSLIINIIYFGKTNISTNPFGVSVDEKQKNQEEYLLWM